MPCPYVIVRSLQFARFVAITRKLRIVVVFRFYIAATDGFPAKLSVAFPRVRVLTKYGLDEFLHFLLSIDGDAT